MWFRQFKPGDKVVYRKSKHTPHPGRRAREIRACSKGDNYSYYVDKFWVISRVLAEGEVVVRTRRGKTHVIDQRDPNLHRPTLWQRVRYHARFAQIQQALSTESPPMRTASG
jgi:hypothetical protein